VSPDGHNLDNYYLARPGADEIQLDLFGDYKRFQRGIGQLDPSRIELLVAWRRGRYGYPLSRSRRPSRTSGNWFARLQSGDRPDVACIGFDTPVLTQPPQPSPRLGRGSRCEAV
jgi:hypothetical protein